MEERLKNISNRLKEFWGKFTNKQRATMLSVAAVIIIALAILGYALSRPTMVTLITCESPKQASEVKELLEGEGIKMTVSDDGSVISVNKKDLSEATLLLGSNSIPTDGYGINDALSGGFSSTEADKDKKYKLYLEEYIATMLESMDSIKDASVKLTIPDDDGTIISQNKETYASVILTLKEAIDTDTAASLARFVATGLGNDKTDSVVIIDSNGSLLFSGEDNTTTVGNASSQLSVKSQAEALVKTQVRDVMLGTNVYDAIEVAPNLKISFDVINETEHTYSPPEGQEQGLLSHEETYEQETQGGTSGVPGTDTNTNTTYEIEDNAFNSSTTAEASKDYIHNEKLKDTQYAPGSIVYDQSSLAIVATSYNIIKEEELKNQGALENMSFDEYIKQNDTAVRTEVDQDLLTMVSHATGIAEENISIIAYEKPVFQATEGSGRTVSDYVMIIMVVLIFALLGFVIFRSTRPVEVLETEPELSVEELLSATREAQPLDDIQFDEKSEARKLIEKFVEEKPEAVAQLLRNWLNEGWE